MLIHSIFQLFCWQISLTKANPRPKPCSLSGCPKRSNRSKTFSVSNVVNPWCAFSMTS